MDEEPVPIGIHGPLSGTLALSIDLPVFVLAAFVLGSAAGVLASLAERHFVTAGWLGLLTAAFSAVLARFLYDFGPQRGWLRGSVLSVERLGGPRECDLATAEVVKLGWTMPTMTRGYTEAVPVLAVRQHKGGSLVRLALRGVDLRILPANELLQLAAALESGPAPSPAAAKTSRRLRKLAESEKSLPPLDWSFRSDPQGTRPSVNASATTPGHGTTNTVN